MRVCMYACCVFARSHELRMIAASCLSAQVKHVPFLLLHAHAPISSQGGPAIVTTFDVRVKFSYTFRKYVLLSTHRLQRAVFRICFHRVSSQS